MSDWKKQWWEDTKKDFFKFVDSIYFLVSVILLTHFVVFSSSEKMKLAQTIIDARDWVIIVCIGLGILTLSIGLEKLIRFLVNIIWLTLTSICLYIIRKLK